MKQEYKVLPQNEKENGGHMIPNRNPTKKCSCCLTTFVILGFIAILGGITGLTVSLLYPHEFNDAVTGYWSGQVDSGSDNNSTGTEIIDEPVSVGDVTFVTGSKTTEKPGGIDKKKGDEREILPTAVPTTTVAPPIVDSDNNGTNVVVTNGTSSLEDSKVTESSTEDDESDEESEELSSAEETSTKAPVEKKPDSAEKPKGKPKKDKKKVEDDTKKETESHTTVDESELKTNKTSNGDEYVEEIVEDAEKYIEKVTGIHRAEIVVPLFMFLCFLMSLLLASCCCYLLMRRRDNRRRRVLGKIITDLQTGDSKSILLDQDMDD